MLNQLASKQIRCTSHAIVEKLTPISKERLVWKTTQNDPRQHTESQEGLYYLLPDDKQLQQIYAFSVSGQPSPFDIETTRFYKTIGMFPLMIRRPFLDASEYLRNVKSGMPNVRILFYGDIGHGKTHTLAHLLHYLHLKQEHIIVNIREMKKFTRSPWSIDQSTSRPGRIDTNVNAALFLQQFKIQNSSLLERHKDTLKCSKDYTWSLREATKAGEPLDKVIEHGINRVLHASDCVAVLLKELSLAADAGQIKLVSVLDNVQFLFYREAGSLKNAELKNILLEELTVARALKKIIKQDYKNGIVLATCDEKLSPKHNLKPQDALGQEGWDHFDPFLPVRVPKYSRKEFESCMNLYQDIGWLTRPESRTKEVRDEIRFISGLNPDQVQYLCQAL